MLRKYLATKLNNEERPEYLPCNSNYSLKRVLINCVDAADVRQTFYFVNIHDLSPTRLTQRMSLVEQELVTLPEHLSSPPLLVGFMLLDL